ncbi:MAG: BrnT family toxin [Myxococcales bacterium]|nr:BrnT family toxin [Myxococcales bacterium]
MSLYSWDEERNAANLERHGLSFEVAVKIFTDPLLVTSDPVEGPDGERTWSAIGVIGPGTLPLVVVYTLHDIAGAAQQVHLLSARPLTGRERHALGGRSAAVGKRAPQVLGHAATPGGLAWFGPAGLRERGPRRTRRTRRRHGD